MWNRMATTLFHTHTHAQRTQHNCSIPVERDLKCRVSLHCVQHSTSRIQWEKCQFLLRIALNGRVEFFSASVECWYLLPVLCPCRCVCACVFSNHRSVSDSENKISRSFRFWNAAAYQITVLLKLSHHWFLITIINFILIVGARNII